MMKRLGVILLILLGLFVGMTFFIVLVIIAVLSVLVHLILKSFGKKPKNSLTKVPSEFIESETLESSFNMEIPLGALPDTSGETIVYHIPPELPNNAKEILIQARIYANSQDRSIERNYELSFTSTAIDPLYFSLYLHPFRENPEHSYNSVRMWFTLPEDATFHITLTAKEQDNSNEELQSEVVIVGVK